MSQLKIKRTAANHNDDMTFLIFTLHISLFTIQTKVIITNTCLLLFS